jgi:hypothetical protein
MDHRRMWTIGVLAALVGVLSWGAVAVTRAQPSEVAWYRIVNEGRSAGTMTSWQRVGAGAASTFPFLDDFEVDIRPRGANVVAAVRDGRSEVSTVINCTQRDAPRHTALRATRTGADQPVVYVALKCSASAPPTE